MTKAELLATIEVYAEAKANHVLHHAPAEVQLAKALVDKAIDEYAQRVLYGQWED